ncbi:hypothetical protein KKC36_02600 [Patescibacteria group bacterium]|nr:hypothetical protein [Patescibacteria group bacterium]
MNNSSFKFSPVNKKISNKERERLFNEFIVSEYLKYGSVDEVFSKNNYELPISYPQVHRILNKWGIVKSVGPNSKLSEAICFMVLLSDKKIPLEKLYKSLPSSFKSSMSTMHRILHNIKEGLIRRYGTALVITAGKNSKKVLVAEDISTPRLELGKPFGSISLPMSYSKKSEDPKKSILRILQQEVFTKDARDKTLKEDLIPNHITPFMFLDIVDVRVNVYHLSFDEKYLDAKNFSSYKLKNYKFIDLDDLSSKNNKFRMGLSKIGLGYQKYLDISKTIVEYKPILIKSDINLELSQMALEYLE